MKLKFFPNGQTQIGDGGARIVVEPRLVIAGDGGPSDGYTHVQVADLPATLAPNTVYFVANGGKVVVTDAAGNPTEYGGGSGGGDISFIGCLLRNPRTDAQANTWVRVEFNTADYDTGSLNYYNGRGFRVSDNGYYLIGGVVAVNTLNDGGKMVVKLKKNGSDFYLLGRGTSGATNSAGFGGSVVAKLNANDIIDLWVYATNNTDIYTGYYTTFWITKLAGL